MHTLLRGFLYAIYFLRAWMRKTGIWYWFLSPERRLEDLTRNLVWRWPQFRKVLITLALLGPGCYIPASHRPNYVYLSGLEDTFSELRNLSREWHGRETARAVFVDRSRGCLVISGKTNVGTQNSTHITMTPQPGRETVQVPVLTIHVHPESESGRGLSDVDYLSFLNEPSHIGMIMLWKSNVLFALKTSATYRGIKPDRVQQRIASISKDTLERPQPGLTWGQTIFSFNKAVCTEFGLTLYEATAHSGGVARRIEVTEWDS